MISVILFFLGGGGGGGGGEGGKTQWLEALVLKKFIFMAQRFSFALFAGLFLHPSFLLFASSFVLLSVCLCSFPSAPCFFIHVLPCLSCFAIFCSSRACSAPCLVLSLNPKLNPKP